jgi:nucleotide-binding universal stress UspA family protein
MAVTHDGPTWSKRSDHRPGPAAAGQSHCLHSGRAASRWCDDPLHAIRSIVLATDLSEHTLLATEYASCIAQERNASFTVMTVVAKEDVEAEQDTVTRLNRMLTSNCRDACTLNFEVKTGEVSAAVLECARRHRANLVVLGSSHGPILSDHLLNTTLSSVVRAAHCPVLVIPASCA